MSKQGKLSLKGLFILVLVVVVVFTGGYLYYLNGIGAVDSSNTEDVIVEVPSGSGATAIMYILNDAGLIKNMNCAKVNARIGGYDSLQANTYIFNKSMTLPEIVNSCRKN